MSWENNIHSELVKRIKRLQAVAKADGFDIRVVSAFRSHAEQNALFAQGRTKPGKKVTNARGGQSYHNFGLACDLAPFINGAICWDEKKFDWSRIGKWAKLVGLEWGGAWVTFKDRPHVQLVCGLSIREAQALYLQKNNLTNVWAYISKHSEPLRQLVADLDEDADDLHKLETLQTSAEIPSQVSQIATDETEAGNTPEIMAQTSPESATETTEKQTVQTPTSEVSKEITTKNEQDVNIPAEVVAPEPQGIAAKLKAGIGTLFGGAALYTAAEKFGAMNLSTQAIILFCAIAFIALIGFMFWAALDAYKAQKKLALEVEAKTNINKKDLVWK